jgi:hypothetical protein
MVGNMIAVYPIERIIVEIVSAILCFVLVRFMAKPYTLAKEVSYLGLPLGFGFLGISYALAAIVYSPLGSASELLWLPLLTRAFAFVFIAIAYFFSSRWSKKGQLFAEITVSLLIIALAIFLIIIFVAPDLAYNSYMHANKYIRIFNLACLTYVVIYTLRSHVKNPDPTTIWIPLGFIFLAISQYSLLFWYIDASFSAFVGSLITRLAGLVLFLFVAYRTFYDSDKKVE